MFFLQLPVNPSEVTERCALYNKLWKSNRKTETVCQKGFAVPWVQAVGGSNVDFKTKTYQDCARACVLTPSTFDGLFIEQMVSTTALSGPCSGIIHLELYSWTVPEQPLLSHQISALVSPAHVASLATSRCPVPPMPHSRALLIPFPHRMSL